MSKGTKHLQQPRKAPESREPSPTVNNGQAEIAHLAYVYWLQRGCPIGSPEEDWSRAERELKKEQVPVA